MKSVQSSRLILDDKERVGGFVAGFTGNGNWSSYTAIGLERGGELIAGAVYDGYYGPSIQIHVAAQPGRVWLRRQWLHAAFAYPFNQLGCRRVTAPIDAGNFESIRLAQHLGFAYETCLKDAVPTGDLLYFVLWKETCRWLTRT